MNDVRLGLVGFIFNRKSTIGRVKSRAERLGQTKNTMKLHCGKFGTQCFLARQSKCWQMHCMFLQTTDMLKVCVSLC